MSATAISFNENNQEVILAGSITPEAADDTSWLAATLLQSAEAVRGRLYVNVKRLTRINNTAFNAIATALVEVCSQHPSLTVTIVTTSVLGWSTRKFSKLCSISDNIAVEEYDKNFYPGQEVLENGGFIPILRTQTKMTWRHEQSILSRHGLRKGMDVADICCGIGDFALLMLKEFKPSRLIAVDHARSSLEYARSVAAEFGTTGVEYILGDAANLLIEDNEFDFVTCRHSLQVFNSPQLILKELFRICKPGGRVYITNEKNSHCLGEPYAESIRWTYNEVARLWDHFNMDIELGPKSRRLMLEAGFDDIRMDTFTVTNLDGHPQEFADIVKAWEDVYAGEMSIQRGDDEEFNSKFRKGFQDHIRAALHPKGYAAWPIWVASGRKPR